MAADNDLTIVMIETEFVYSSHIFKMTKQDNTEKLKTQQTVKQIVATLTFSVSVTYIIADGKRCSGTPD